VRRRHSKAYKEEDGLRLWRDRAPRPPEGPRALQPAAEKGSSPGRHPQSDAEIEICPSFDFAVRPSKRTHKLMPHPGMLIECLRRWKLYPTTETKLKLMRLFELVHMRISVLKKSAKLSCFLDFFANSWNDNHTWNDNYKTLRKNKEPPLVKKRMQPILQTGGNGPSRLPGF
jgi:hypothetical protein